MCMDQLTIGKLAKQAGVGIQTVRFYERQGLIQKPPKRGGFHYYSSEDAKRIRFIKRAQEVGFTLREVQELLDLRIQSTATCGDVKHKTDEKITEVEAKIRDLHRIKRSLKQLSEACVRQEASASQCPVLDRFEDGRHCDVSKTKKR